MKVLEKKDRRVREPMTGQGFPIMFGDVCVGYTHSEDTRDMLEAAPELLAACKGLVAVYDRVGGPLAVDPAVATARSAIADAEGGA